MEGQRFEGPPRAADRNTLTASGGASDNDSLVSSDSSNSLDTSSVANTTSGSSAAGSTLGEPEERNVTAGGGKSARKSSLGANCILKTLKGLKMYSKSSKESKSPQSSLVQSKGAAEKQ